jgi:hypothetical protein
MEGRQLIMVLAPKKGGKPAVKAAAPKKTAAPAKAAVPKATAEAAAGKK